MPARTQDPGMLFLPARIPLSRGDDWVTAGVAAAALRQVPQASIPGSFSSDEHPPGTRTPSLLFLLCVIEHPNPRYLYPDLMIQLQV